MNYPRDEMIVHQDSQPSGWRQRILRVAIGAFGRTTVAERLNVSLFVLEDWLEDCRAMPTWKLSMLIDLIEAENVTTT